MVDDQSREIEQKPIWGKVEKVLEYDNERCGQGDHRWLAFFLTSGRLAYWQCEGCGIKDREIGRLPEPLDSINGWVRTPPRLTVRGAYPLKSAKRWETERATVLFEGDPSSIHFVGEEIPELQEAHTYIERDERGNVEAVYEPSRERHSPYGDHYTLTRYQVVDSDLVRFESHCFEESTFDTPYADKPKRRVVLSGLKPLQP